MSFPPFATNEPRYQPSPRDIPNARTPHHDGYVNDNNFNGNRQAGPNQFAPQQMPVPLAAPKPGYAAPIAALNMSQPSFSPDTAPQRHQFPPGPSHPHMQDDRLEAPRMPAAVARLHPPPVAPIPVPSTPHPLPPTMSPILPVFARPSKPTQAQDVAVKWGPESILRGNSEEKLLPRRGETGDDFWRRFSMVAREESTKPYSQKQSAWLRKTQSDTNRMSRWIWVVGLLLLFGVGLGIAGGLYLSHKSAPHQDPTALGGGADQTDGITATQQASISLGSSPAHVIPTNTVARRFPSDSLPTSVASVSIRAPQNLHSRGSNFDRGSSRHYRRYLNRAIP